MLRKLLNGDIGADSSYTKCKGITDVDSKIKCILGIYNSEDPNYVNAVFSYYLQWKEYFKSNSDWTTTE